MGRSKNIYPVTAENFDSLLAYLNDGGVMDWFLLFAFPHSEFEDHMERIRLLKNAVFQRDRSDFLKNVIVLGDYVRGYMANDLGVRGVLNVPKVSDELVYAFAAEFKRNEGKFIDAAAFLRDYGKKNHFDVDIYDSRDPWIISVNNTGILLINERTAAHIDENIGRIRNLRADMILVSFNGNEADATNAELLDLLGSDSHMTFGVTTKKSVPWNRRLDALVYMKSPFKEEYMRKFLVEALESRDFDNNFERLRDFLGVAPKDFSADPDWDEAAELAAKKEARYRLKLHVFDREAQKGIRGGFGPDRLTVIRGKKGTFRGKKKIEVLTLERILS